MSRAVFTYKTKDEMRQMGLMDLDSYTRRLRGMAKRGGPVGKSAAKELAVALKLRESLITKIAVGDV
jgi:hypothetical protein